MKKSLTIRLLLVAALAATTAIANDRWEDGDDGNGTANQLVHGTEQAHDLQAVGAVADQDWYRISLGSRSSYEVVVDGTAAVISPATVGFLALVDSAGTVVQDNLGAELAANTLPSRAVRIENTAASASNNNFIRVRSNGCTTACGADAVYNIRMFETTYFVPRFNNSATQATVLIIQNSDTGVFAINVSGNIWFFDALGNLLASHAFQLGPRSTLVLNTTTVPGVAGQSGSMVVTHNQSYGKLAGKAVAVEAATGFTFDTLMVPRAR